MDQSVGASVYAGRITRTLNNGFIGLMISIGHRLGLFDVLATMPPSTSEQLAAAAGLAERYVREWLAAMTTAHILDYDERAATYFLHVEYAAVLSRGAGTNNLAPVAELLSLLASTEDLVVEGFRSGGGVPQETYERLDGVVAAEKRLIVDESYVDALLDLVPGMRMHLDLGARVLDAGSGDGTLLQVMTDLFPRSTFRSAPDPATLDEPRTYDLVLAFDAIHQHPFPRVVLRNIAASLKRDGIFLMQEIAASSHLSRNIDHPFAPMLYALSTMHSIPLALGQEGEALGRMWGKERAAKMLGEAGVQKREVRDPGGGWVALLCCGREIAAHYAVIPAVILSEEVRAVGSEGPPAVHDGRAATKTRCLSGARLSCIGRGSFAPARTPPAAQDDRWVARCLTPALILWFAWSSRAAARAREAATPHAS
jgi:2-polyprenyl-3-methyl-5-hydroxy-6-metoxy-1,4-benzoquinol methylase